MRLVEKSLDVGRPHARMVAQQQDFSGSLAKFLRGEANVDLRINGSLNIYRQSRDQGYCFQSLTLLYTLMI